jgi:hypothetical protein
MKQSIITISTLLIITITFAKPAHTYDVKDYVVTKSGIEYYEKLRTGFNNTLVAVKDQEKKKFDLNDVKMFRINGKVFKRFYFVQKNSNFVKSILLQKLCTKAGYTIYIKEKGLSEENDISDFYVFYNGKFQFRANNKNYKAVLSFFSPYCNLLFNS